MSTKSYRKPNGFKFLIAAIVALLIFYSFKLNSDYKKLEDAFSEQKIELQSELDEIIEDYRNINVKNKDLSKRLIKEINKIIVLRDSIKNLKKSNYNLIVKYSRKIVKLERENRRLFIQVDSLNKQNYELLQENIVVKKKLNENNQLAKSLTAKNETLMQKQEVLEEKMSIAEVIEIDNFQAIAMKERSSGKLTSTSRSRRTDAFKIKFDLQPNPVTSPGKKEILIQILDENKNVVAAKGNKIMKSGDTIVFSDNIVADYDNQQLGVVSLVLVNRGDINKGKYTVNTYVDGQFSGKTDLSLR
ncbi:hypothetical protein [Tenacibaculum sp. M341]|uniref:hypothetical protein n=1 Tax=Tenacibaculum sp. M341 TaxID=2530339 RepID=UPI00104C52F7|nr:hypothetical protein [Tenacibaculum sp. M341]TCI92280.1 hypothetical protein EYW44_08855 [Tenacibaculum sp. M341]